MIPVIIPGPWSSSISHCRSNLSLDIAATHIQQLITICLCYQEVIPRLPLKPCERLVCRLLKFYFKLYYFTKNNSYCNPALKCIVVLGHKTCTLYKATMGACRQDTQVPGRIHSVSTALPSHHTIP